MVSFPASYQEKLLVLSSKGQQGIYFVPESPDIKNKSGLYGCKGDQFWCISGNFHGHVGWGQGRSQKIFWSAVALTSGRIKEAINTELSRLEAERSLREVDVKEIRSELLDRGDIRRFWDEKIKEERSHGFEVEMLYIVARCDLEQELIDQEKSYAEDLKEKVAMDCQRQLLLNLKEEVDEMSGRLASKRAMYAAEKCELQDMLNDLQA